MTSCRFRRWTPAEDAIIAAHFPSQGAKALTKVLDRTRSAIQHRAEVLGIGYGAPVVITAPIDTYTSHEVEVRLKRNWQFVRELLQSGALTGEQVPGIGKGGVQWQISRASVEAYERAHPKQWIPTEVVRGDSRVLAGIHAVIANLDPTKYHAGLATACIAQALHDVHDPREQPEAQAWLQHTGRRWLELLGAGDELIEELLEKVAA